MKDRDLRYIGLSASWLSICVTGLLMLRAASSRAGADIIPFILWGISPYAILIFGEFIIRKTAIVPKVTKFFCVIAILLLVFTLYAYVGVIGNKSSTASLIYVFLPFYLNISVVVLVVSGLIWAALSKSSEK